MKRVNYKREPVLKAHRWIVCVEKARKEGKRKCWQTRLHYCMTKKEARAVRNAAPKGSIIEIFRSHHNFVEAWSK